MRATITDKINAATLADAKKWAATFEQFTFCADFLEISAFEKFADVQIDRLELVFQGLLDQEAAVAVDDMLATIAAVHGDDAEMMAVEAADKAKRRGAI